MEKLYSTNEVAVVLKVTTRTIRRWKKAGKLCPRTSQLGQDYYAEEDIRTFVRTHQLGQGENVLTNIEIVLGQLGHTEDIAVRTSRTQDTIRTSDRTSDRTLGQEEKIKSAHLEAANNPKSKDTTSEQKSKDPIDDLPAMHFKPKKKASSYSDWLQHRKELADRAKQYLSNLLYELGVTNLSKNFHCINPVHNDSAPSMTYYTDTNCVHCHGCGFHGNIFQVYATVQNRVIDKALFD